MTHIHAQSSTSIVNNLDASFVVVAESLSHVRLCTTPWSARRRPPCPSPILRVCSDSCLLSRWYHPTISSSATTFSFFLQSFPASKFFPVSQLFTSGGQSIGVSATVFPIIIRVDFIENWLVWSPWSERDTQESLGSQLESISSSLISLLYSPILTSIHDYWKNHSFNYMDLCWPSDVSAF